MLKANAVFNIFAGVFDVRNCVFRVLNYVRQNIAVVFDALAFDSLCFDYVLANTVLFHILLCELRFDYSLRILFYNNTLGCIMRTAIRLFVFRILLFQIRVSLELGR